jgi:hypothetical protein
MEAVRASETSVSFYKTTMFRIAEGCHLHTCHRDNLKSHFIKFRFILQNFLFWRITLKTFLLYSILNSSVVWRCFSSAFLKPFRFVGTYQSFGETCYREWANQSGLSALQMEKIYFSETLVSTCKPTRRQTIKRTSSLPWKRQMPLIVNVIFNRECELMVYIDLACYFWTMEKHWASRSVTINLTMGYLLVRGLWRHRFSFKMQNIYIYIYIYIYI